MCCKDLWVVPTWKARQYIIQVFRSLIPLLFRIHGGGQWPPLVDILCFGAGTRLHLDRHAPVCPVVLVIDATCVTQLLAAGPTTPQRCLKTPAIEALHDWLPLPMTRHTSNRNPHAVGKVGPRLLFNLNRLALFPLALILFSLFFVSSLSLCFCYKHLVM